MTHKFVYLDKKIMSVKLNIMDYSFFTQPPDRFRYCLLTNKV